MRFFLWGDVEGGLKDSRIETNWGAEFCGHELERADLSKGKGTLLSFFSVISSCLSVDPACIEMNIFMWGVGWYDLYILDHTCTILYFSNCPFIQSLVSTVVFDCGNLESQTSHVFLSGCLAFGVAARRPVGIAGVNQKFLRYRALSVNDNDTDQNGL